MSGRRITEYLHETLGLQTKAARRYGDRSMRRDSQRGKGFRRTALLSAFMCFTAVAQGQSQDNFESLFKHAFDLHQRAQFTEAIPLLEQARRLEPGDYFTNLLLGIDLLRTGKAREALPRLEIAAHAKPEEEIPEGYLGEANASLGHYAQAADDYRARSNAGMIPSRHLEAWAGFALERFREIGENLRATEAGVATVRRLVAAAAKSASSLVCEGCIPALEQKLAFDGRGRKRNAEMETAYKLVNLLRVEAGNAAGELQEGCRRCIGGARLRGDVLLRLKGDPVGRRQEYRRAMARSPTTPHCWSGWPRHSCALGTPRAQGVGAGIAGYRSAPP